MKKALILGITGQIGSYLAEHLLAQGYEVHGVIRRSSVFNTARIEHIFDRLQLYHGDVNDQASLAKAILKAGPGDLELYNLAAQSHVRVSFDVPEATCAATGMGVLNVLQIAHELEVAKVYQASSSEIFGNEPAPQNELTKIAPRSPYGCAKAFGYHLAKMYREAHGMYVVNGILFNQESVRRGETFVTRKITRAVGRIAAGIQRELVLGNLDARRDWTWAGDGARAIHAMMQEDRPSDFVIGSGRSATVREFCELAFRAVGRDWRAYVRTDPKYQRPAEVDHLRADPTKAMLVLGWSPTLTLEKLVAAMVKHDQALALREAFR